MTGVFLRGRVYWYRHTVAGKQVFESLNTSDEAEAIRLAQAIIDSPEQAKAQPWEVELKRYLDERVNRKRMSTNARVGRLSVLKKFGLEYEITSPAHVTQRRAEDWYEDLQEKVEETTAQTYLRWLTTFLDHLVDKRRLRKNPVDVEFDRAVKKKRKPFCSPEQVRALKQAGNDPGTLFILYCGFDAGLRRGEIAEARPEWFDLTNGLLHVQRSDTWEPKDRDDRTIPLTTEFLAFLKNVYGLPSPFMLPGKALKRRERKWRYRYDPRAPFERLLEKVGGGEAKNVIPAIAQGRKNPTVTMHTMRRTFASHLVSAGVSLYKVALWLGDLEKVVQDSYGYLIPKDADIERGR